uniref:Uncharacterized protein n=1 Tax=Lepeophtheirus salmonis TaxID=72036 RepID=A0A0K2V5R0_LEPSM
MIYFSRRTKQCSLCFNFGYFAKECNNKSKSPSEYRRWVGRRMNRKNASVKSIPYRRKHRKTVFNHRKYYREL